MIIELQTIENVCIQMIRLMLDPITRVIQLSSQQQICDAENDWIKPFLTENDVIKRLGWISWSLCVTFSVINVLIKYLQVYSMFALSRHHQE